MESNTKVFAEKLKQHLEASPKLTRRGAKVLAVLKSRPSRRKERQIRRMELHAAAELDQDGAVDWNALNWDRLIEQILSVLLKVLGGILKL